MSIVLVIFTSGVTQAFSAENKVDTSSSAENQLVVAFQRLDKEIRYASAISTPGTTSGDPVVEFESPNINVTHSSTYPSSCTEVRLHVSTGQLQQRTWQENVSPLVPTGWQQLASSATSATPQAVATQDGAVSVVAPFAVLIPVGNVQFQQLEVAIKVTLGVNKTASTKASDITFTALNTSSATTLASSGAVCTAGRGVSW